MGAIETSTLSQELRKTTKDALKEAAKKSKVTIDEIKKHLKKDREEDSFTSALRMAIENDGEVDSKELKYLKKLIRKTSKQKSTKKTKTKYRLRIRFAFFLFPYPVFEKITIHSSKNKKGKANKNINHNLREAFNIAAIDGKISNSEIKNLETLF